ncbi:hypothetical protein VB780_26025 [Leptolyngbya sp. CCNP1308]|uniref:hypothetical protein n=1 Tax=Leptolyngbya sp. CCNP1308 TaxID=3110255 RepID=UPI002B1F2B07|nr:hypothetical protein [Leptolyngbya sp. CCNP1308]MEA5452059.1 hypothetical protein [Leptolyngbya sp. CCNP1308]
MAGNPEKTRRNALLSTGPRTAEGKAIAARNRTTHGLLAKQPPLLDSEDFSTFEGILQGLIKQYQPQGPLENHLIQQIGMCMLRQHRAWQAEAIAGDRHAANATLTQYYPEEKSGGGLDALVAALATGGGDRRTPTHPEVLTTERRCLAALAEELETAWLGAPKSKAAFSKWCRRPMFEDDDQQSNYTWACGHIAQAVAEACKGYPDPARPKEHDHTHPLLIGVYLSHSCQQPPETGDLWLSDALYHRERSQTLCAAIAARIEAIDQALTEIEHLTALTKQSHSISDELELIGRYESRNSRQLKQAIEQLQQLQAARQSADGISLNGKKGLQLKVVGQG